MQIPLFGMQQIFPLNDCQGGNRNPVCTFHFENIGNEKGKKHGNAYQQTFHNVGISFFPQNSSNARRIHFLRDKHRVKKRQQHRKKSAHRNYTDTCRNVIQSKGREMAIAPSMIKKKFRGGGISK